MLSDKDIYHFYHAYADGENSAFAVEVHLNNLISSNLSKYLKKFYVGIVGSDVNRAKIKQLLLSRANDLPLEIVVEAIDGFEQITLKKMHDHSKTQQGIYFYAHSKSAANVGSHNECWMHTMEYYNLLNWPKAIYSLKKNDAAGCFWLTFERCPDIEHWNDVKPDTNSFFAGNYWWSTSEVIKELKIVDTSNRYMAEQWIGNKHDLKVYNLRRGFPRQRNFNCTRFGIGCKCSHKKYLKRIRKITVYFALPALVYLGLQKILTL